jgi:hypothetical protein
MPTKPLPVAQVLPHRHKLQQESIVLCRLRPPQCGDHHRMEDEGVARGIERSIQDDSGIQRTDREVGSASSGVPTTVGNAKVHLPPAPLEASLVAELAPVLFTSPLTLRRFLGDLTSSQRSNP